MKQPSLAELIKMFVREAAQRIETMSELLDALAEDSTNANALEELSRRFHGFAGIGGLDGFEVINALGAHGEAECRRLLSDGTGPSFDQVQSWDSILEVMKSEVSILARSVAKVYVMPPQSLPRAAYSPRRRSAIVSVPGIRETKRAG